MKAIVAACNQEKALVGAFAVITFGWTFLKHWHGPLDPATHTQRVEKFLPQPSRVRKLGSSSNLRPARPDTSVSPSPSPPRLRSSLIIISKSPARLSWTNLIINNDQDQPPSWPVLAPRPRTPDNDATRWRWPGAGAASPSRKSSGCDGTDDGGSCRQCSHFSCSAAALWELRRVKIDGAASRLRTRDPVTDGFPHLLKILCGNLSFDLKWWISAQTAIIIQ